MYSRSLERDNITHPAESAVARMLRDSDISSVVVGVSGGADSTALLVALRKTGVSLRVLHCNFHLRGWESDRDEAFVSRLCSRLGVPLDCRDVDVDAYRLRHAVSVEVACRETRYAIFREAMQEYGADRIAVAHNADDQAETLLLNLFRGAGVKGLGAMLRDTGEIIRPLLGVTRDEIIDYLRNERVDYVTDSTNLSSCYRRNFIRREVLPLVASRWPGVRDVLVRTASSMQSDAAMLRCLEESLVPGDALSLQYAVLWKCPDAAWLIRRFAARFGVSAVVSCEIARSVCSPDFIPTKFWDCRGGRLAAGRDSLYFIPDGDAVSDWRDSFVVEELECGSITVEAMSRMKSSSNMEFWGSVSPDDIEFRHVREGDRIDPLGMEGSQLVSRVMKNAKFSESQKRGQWVVAERSTGRILWLPGLRRSRHALVSPGRDAVCVRIYSKMPST